MTLRRGLVRALMCFCFSATVAWGAEPAGPLAQWDFDEGQGDIAHDATGHGHNAILKEASWVKDGKTFAVSLDGITSYIDCGESAKLGVGGPISIEAWIKPMRKPHGESTLLGEAFDSNSMPGTSALVTFYNGDNVYWYIGNGGNGISGTVHSGAWNHVAASFDGKRMNLWINGRLAGNRESKIITYAPRGNFLIGAKASETAEKFQGLVTLVKVYDRALSAEEVTAHYQAKVNELVDLTWQKRIKTALYLYPERNEVLAEANYSALQPSLSGKARLEGAISSKAKPDEVIVRRSVDTVSAWAGMAEVTLPCQNLPPGDYLLRVTLEDAHGAYPEEELSFSCPMPSRPLPSPAERVAAPLPAPLGQIPFDVTVGKGGGFTIKTNGASYAFQTRVSWPKGEFNRLVADDAAYRKGERSWKVKTQSSGKESYEVNAGGKCYTIHREVTVFPTHVFVKDTYTNVLKEDLGLLVYNETPVSPGQVALSRLSGYDRRGRQAELGFPHYSLSAFFADAHTGMGIVPMDDVYIVQAVPYVDWEGAAGVGTEKFALAPGASYTLEWAVYPTASKDYYDFINTFRKVENRISTVEAAPGYTSYSLHSRRQVPDDKFIAERNLGIGIIPCIYYPADDPDLNMEGIEFIDFPKEREMLKLQATAIHKKHPGFKMVFHIAHSLFATNNPDRFADSKVIDAEGKQTTWGGGEYFGDKYGAAGWRYWIFYPSPGNSFHDAMMKSVDVLMDEMGFDGGQMDGFFAGYGGLWTYGRWDEHSAEIDPVKKTIKRKLGSVLLLSQPSMIEFSRKIRDKGGVVIGMHTVFTRTMANEKYILFSDEDTGPGMHLAPNMVPLSRPSHKNEKEMYLDMLEKLSWGEMFSYYSEPTFFTGLTHPTLAARQFPITFEEIRSGMVKGKERIVTMNSGVYGWTGDDRLHAVYKFDGRGAPVPNDFVTTVDGSTVRTQLDFGRDESAVIEPAPARLKAGAPVNLRVLQYDASTLKVVLNGKGDATLEVFVGSSETPRYTVTVGAERTTPKDVNGILAIPLKLAGAVEVTVAQLN